LPSPGGGSLTTISKEERAAGSIISIISTSGLNWQSEKFLTNFGYPFLPAAVVAQQHRQDVVKQ
jgi:hypothetical protein